MSCCGGSSGTAHAWVEETAAPRPAMIEEQPVESLVEFEYMGRTRLVVRGPLTGLRYEFPEPNARLFVDGRDASYFTGVPHLRKR